MPDPVPPSPSEPVMTAAWIQAAILSVAAAVLAVLGAFGKWTPTPDQWTAITAAVATVIAVFFPLVGWVVRSKVTPVSSLGQADAPVEPDPVPTDWSKVPVRLPPVRLSSPDEPLDVTQQEKLGVPPEGMFLPE